MVFSLAYFLALSLIFTHLPHSLEDSGPFRFLLTSGVCLSWQSAQFPLRNSSPPQTTRNFPLWCEISATWAQGPLFKVDGPSR